MRGDDGFGRAADRIDRTREFGADIELVETSLNSDVNVAAVDVVFPVRVENSLGRCGLGDPDTDHGLQ